MQKPVQLFPIFSERKAHLSGPPKPYPSQKQIELRERET